MALAAGAFSSSVVTAAPLAVAAPRGLTLSEASTLPIPFVTAWFALHEAARLKSGERVLIHAAAGGVGLAAVQLAQRAGAEVFATAGSETKRAYLRSIGVRHVMSSRTTDFADAIREATGGQGVDVVLNSLSGEFIDRSFDAIANGGRFVEIGKSGWTAERVAALGRGIEFTELDWTGVARTQPAAIHDILSRIVAEVERGALKPLPQHQFAITEAADAFRFMAQAKHLGKIVLTHQQPAVGPVIRADRTYLVTGGLSGLGLATAAWLAEQGARTLLLTGRREPTAEARQQLAILERDGVKVEIHVGDIAEEADVAAMLARPGVDLPLLAGIFHSAGVLDDGALAQQNWQRFRTVMAPKVRGAVLLDRASASQPLELFVLYSSVASVLGSAGQANHAAANAYLDIFAHARRARGLHALSINWGVWSEIGAGVRHGVDKRVQSQGIATIDPTRRLCRARTVDRDGRGAGRRIADRLAALRDRHGAGASAAAGEGSGSRYAECGARRAAAARESGAATGARSGA